MKLNIERILTKEELRKMSAKDDAESLVLDPNAVEVEKKETTDKMIGKYKVKDKTKFDMRKRDVDIGELSMEIHEDKVREEEPLEAPSLDYNALKDDFARLESYKNLSQQYNLTNEERETIGEIYGRIKYAEEHLDDVAGQYKDLTEKVKSMADTTKRIMDEISGGYIKDIGEYKPFY